MMGRLRSLARPVLIAPRSLALPALPVHARFISPFDLQNQDPNNPAADEDNADKGGGSNDKRRSPAVDSALSTLAGIVLLAGSGITYHYWYKQDQLRKIRRAFKAGYDPVLALASASAGGHATATVSSASSRLDQEEDTPPHIPIRRKEQDYIDAVVNGEVSGEYLLLLGPKGVGKSTLIVNAMVKNEADGVAMMEAHEDPEVFRLRLGKAIDFEFNEDSFAGLFQRKDPREGGALLDIERALNKLEKVAIKYRQERGRPLVMIFNNVHFIHNDEDGHALLHVLQQRAESWAQAGVLTCIFNSDDFAPYQHLKQKASRMHVLSINDLTPSETHFCLNAARRNRFGPSAALDPDVSLRVWDLVGGRLAYLNKIVGEPTTDAMIDKAQEMVNEERGWLEHRLGLIPGLDDDVMDASKVDSCSFLLFQEFARLGDLAEGQKDSLFDQEAFVLEHSAPLPPTATRPTMEGQELEKQLIEAMDVSVTWGEARVIMTRPDFITDLDTHNIIAIDKTHRIRPDSRLMLNVFKTICNEDGFQEKLDSVRDRIDEIESLHRTAELTVKDANDLGGFLRLRVGRLEDAPPKNDDSEESEEPGLTPSRLV